MTPPQMRRTTVLDLVVPFAIVGVAVYVLLRVSYDSIPPLNYAAAVPLAVLAVAELVAARRVRAAVRHVHGAKPMEAIVIARCVALGKASSLVGAAVGGGAAALLVRVLPDADTVRAAAHDARAGGFLLAASVLIVGAGLLLERAGLDPNRDRHDDEGGRAAH
jgi:hypothetical protein